MHDEDNLLLGFINIRGLKEERWKEKYIRVMKTLKYYNFDIIGLSEVNIHWPLEDPGRLLGRYNQWTLGSQKLSHGLKYIRCHH